MHHRGIGRRRLALIGTGVLAAPHPARAQTGRAFRFGHVQPPEGEINRGILRAAELLREAVPLLAAIGPNATRINLLCEQIRQVEGEADDVHDSGVAALYRRAAPEGALAFIAGREILDQLEKVVDRFDDAANAIEGIVVEQV